MSTHDPHHTAHDNAHDNAHPHRHDGAPEHDHDHEGSELSAMDLRVRALESLLVEKGYVDPQALDVLIETYEHQVGPRNGATVVAKAWSDPAYRKWLQDEGVKNIANVNDHLKPARPWFEFYGAKSADELG